MKHEKKGTLFAANTLVVCFVITTILQAECSGFIVSVVDINKINIFFLITSAILPIIMWCAANWSITTLLDGEGTFKDIYMATAYALTPVIIANAILLILSNTLVKSELGIYAFISSLSLLWTAFLLLIGIMTIHQFSFGRTVFSIIITILGMIVILAIAMLFFSLISRIYFFVIQIITELQLR